MDQRIHQYSWFLHCIVIDDKIMRLACRTTSFVKAKPFKLYSYIMWTYMASLQVSNSMAFLVLFEIFSKHKINILYSTIMAVGIHYQTVQFSLSSKCWPVEVYFYTKITIVLLVWGKIIEHSIMNIIITERIVEIIYSSSSTPSPCML